VPIEDVLNQIVNGRWSKPAKRKSSPPESGSQVGQVLDPQGITGAWNECPYSTSCMEALRRLSALGWDLGIREWLEKSDPRLFDEIYTRLPGLIDSFWGRAPLAEFGGVLDALVAAHEEALKAYRDVQQRRTG
jgi:hypothetical protein